MRDKMLFCYINRRIKINSNKMCFALVRINRSNNNKTIYAVKSKINND